MSDEETPLLGRRAFRDDHDAHFPRNPHEQFCTLVGIKPSNRSKSTDPSGPGCTTLYERARKKRSSQQMTYTLTASLSNTLLLSQVVLGATLTALGASESSHILITIFGVLNTIIAGLVAYLKSRGQPMRARMFRDDLDRIVNEIENSEIMWLGITRNAHGYSEIDIDEEVSVRSEVARLTRLYDRAVKNNSQNNPDLYMTGGLLDAVTGLRARQPTGPQSTGTDQPAAPPAAPAEGASTTTPPTTVAPTEPDPDESPATAKSKPNAKATEAPKKTDVEPSKPDAGSESFLPGKDASPGNKKTQNSQLD